MNQVSLGRERYGYSPFQANHANDGTTQQHEALRLAYAARRVRDAWHRENMSYMSYDEAAEIAYYDQYSSSLRVFPDSRLAVQLAAALLFNLFPGEPRGAKRQA